MRYLIMLLVLAFAPHALIAQQTGTSVKGFNNPYTYKYKNGTILPLLQEAEMQFQSFDFEGTLATLDNALAQEPNSFEVLTFSARVKKILGMQAEAENDLNLVNRINPIAPNLYGYNGNRGLLNIISFEPQEAVKDLNRSQKAHYYYEAIDENIIADEKSQLEWGDIEQTIMDIELNNLEDALTRVNSILKGAPKSAIVYDLKGVILKKQQRYDEALASFSKAVTIEPDFAIAWYNFGQVEQILGNYEVAKKYFDRAIELQEDLTKAYFNRAFLLKQMGDRESALEDYNTIIEKRGDTYMEAYLNRGLTKKLLGDYTGALVDLNQAIEEYPENPQLLINRGNINLLFGLTLDAIADYTKAIKMDPAYAEAYYNRALSYLMIYDNNAGCMDMNKSADLGYSKATEALQYFCVD